MTAPRYGAPDPSSGERWNVNLPAVIGVIFVFLVAVIVWVIATAGGDDDATTSTTPTPPTSPTTSAGSDDSVAPSPTATDGVETTAPGTTSTAPMPSTVAAPTTAPPPTTTPPPATEVTAAPAAGPGAVPGDLGISGRPMQRPGCDGAFITIIASAVGDDATAGGIGNVLDAYPSSNYLRTDRSCPSLAQDKDGEPIYVVYFGPFAFDSDACAARADGPEGAYARALSSELDATHTVPCT
jgi:serine/threonine-protein kinase